MENEGAPGLANTLQHETNEESTNLPDNACHCTTNISNNEMEYCIASLCPVRKDKSENVVWLLQEAEQSVSSRDLLIGMLQDQLKKIENLYKKSLDDTQNLRYRYCSTAQELGNFKKICQTYKEEIEKLKDEKKQKDLSQTEEELQALQNEANKWKTQYEEVLNKIAQMESDTAAMRQLLAKESEASLQQPGFIGEQEKKSEQDTDILKHYFENIENTLNQQNEKLEILVNRLQGDLQKTNQGHIGIEKKLSISQSDLIEITIEARKLRQATKTMHETSLERLWDENRQLRKQVEVMKGSNVQSDVSGSNLRDGKSLEELKMENVSLKNQLADLEYLKEENMILIRRIQNAENQIREHMEYVDQDFSHEKELQQENLDTPGETKDGIHIPQKFIVARDSIFETYKKENEELREEVAKLRQRLAISIPMTFKECLCAETPDAVKPLKITNPMGRVSFAAPHDLNVEIVKLNKENSELQSIIEKLQGLEPGNIELVHKTSVEAADLKKELKEKDIKIGELHKELGSVSERTNNIIKDLTEQNQAVKNDYENLEKKLLELQLKMQEVDGQKLELDQMKEESQKLKDQLKTIDSEKLSKEEKIEALQEDIEHKDNEFKKCYCLINSLTVDNNQLSQDIEKLTGDKSSKEEEIEKLNENIEQNKELQRDYAELQKKLSELQQKVEEADNQKLEIDQMREENQKLKDQLKNLDSEKLSKEEEIKTLNERINQTEKEFKECCCRIESLKDDSTQFYRNIEKLNRDNTLLSSELEITKRTLDQYKDDTEFKEAETAKLKEKEEELKGTLANERSNSLKNQAELKNNIDNLQKALEEATSKYDRLNAEMENNLQLKEEYETLKKDHEKLKEELENRKGEIEKLKKSHETLQTEMEDTHNMLMKRNKIAERELDEIKSVYRRLENELHRATLEYEAHIQEHLNVINDLKNAGEAYQKQLLESDKIVKQYEQNCACLKGELNAKTQESQTFQDKYKQKIVKSDELKMLIGKLTKENEELRKAIEDLIKKFEDELQGAMVLNRELTHKSEQKDGNFCGAKGKFCPGPIKKIPNNSDESSPMSKQVCQNLDMEELKFKRNYLVERLKCIDVELNHRNAPLQRSKSKSASDLGKDYKKCCDLPQFCEKCRTRFKQLQPQPKFSNTVKVLYSKDDKIPKLFKVENKVIRSSSLDSFGDLTNPCGLKAIDLKVENTKWSENLDSIRKMRRELFELKKSLLRESNNGNSSSMDNNQACSTLANRVKDLKEQIEVTAVMENEINELRQQLNSRYNQPLDEDIARKLETCIQKNERLKQEFFIYTKELSFNKSIKN